MKTQYILPFKKLFGKLVDAMQGRVLSAANFESLYLRIFDKFFTLRRNGDLLVKMRADYLMGVSASDSRRCGSLKVL